ncbi:MAG: recombinase family protein [Oscillospiraceae bacterium]|nr:recombinase family protein [Oscillospiraceae bacterium]
MGKKRVAAYVRVSTASDAQIHSYEFQEQYWRGKFTNDPDRELVGIYADRGISGNSIKKRDQFQAMLQDARGGKLDVIYTKSVSRFARNTVDLLDAVRELRDLGVEVVFEKENISTFQPASELYLTIAASIAENELQVDSERQQWSVRHRYENGWISIGHGMCGYRMLPDNTLEIVPEEAEIIRRIFNMYLAGHGSDTIARALNKDGLRTSAGKPWSHQTVLRALENEKYMGDTLSMKSVKRHGVKLMNTDGQYAPRYYIEDTHPGIVSKEDFQAAQELRQQRKNGKITGQKRAEHPFSGLVECGLCHSRYIHKVNGSGLKWQSDIWACYTNLHKGASACRNTRIKDEILKEKFVEAYNEFVRERPLSNAAAEITGEIQKLERADDELSWLALRGLLPKAAYSVERQQIKEKLNAKRSQLQKLKRDQNRDLDYFLITEFSEEKLKEFITKVIVLKGTVTFVFYNGVEISRSYTNGKPGNAKGWNKKEA